MEFCVVELTVEESSAAFWIFDIKDRIAESMSWVVFSGMLSVILFSRRVWNLDYKIFPGVRVGYDLIMTEESFSVRMIGEWSEERSVEFVMVKDMWFGSVEIKKSRMSGCLLWCEG